MSPSAKEAGLGVTTLSVDDAGGTLRAIRNDITNFNFSTPRAVQDSTGVDKFAMERLHLLADVSWTLNGIFNDALNMSHDVFKTVPSTSVSRTITLSVSGQTFSSECLLTDYALTRPQSGELTFQVPGSLADGTTPVWS